MNNMSKDENEFHKEVFTMASNRYTNDMERSAIEGYLLMDKCKCAHIFIATPNEYVNNENEENKPQIIKCLFVPPIIR